MDMSKETIAKVREEVADIFTLLAYVNVSHHYTECQCHTCVSRRKALGVLRMIDGVDEASDFVG